MPQPDSTISSKFEKLSVPVKLLTAGSAACFADFASFPLDTAKVRLQVSSVVSCYPIERLNSYVSHTRVNAN